jgi:hypothetical protein
MLNSALGALGGARGVDKSLQFALAFIAHSIKPSHYYICRFGRCFWMPFFSIHRNILGSIVINFEKTI